MRLIIVLVVAVFCLVWLFAMPLLFGCVWIARGSTSLYHNVFPANQIELKALLSTPGLENPCVSVRGYATLPHQFCSVENGTFYVLILPQQTGTNERKLAKTLPIKALAMSTNSDLTGLPADGLTGQILPLSKITVDARNSDGTRHPVDPTPSLKHMYPRLGKKVSVLVLRQPDLSTFTAIVYILGGLLVVVIGLITIVFVLTTMLRKNRA